MAGSGSADKWDISSVSDGDIQEFKRSAYLPTDIAHRAPEKGQVVPTPRPGERVLCYYNKRPSNGARNRSVA
ncbi:wall-associated receptor kinase 3 [Hordeum vulgare]|nr:wall-associated receptor kinase 3 [Hordeum vulgare]